MMIEAPDVRLSALATSQFYANGSGHIITQIDPPNDILSISTFLLGKSFPSQTAPRAHLLAVPDKHLSFNSLLVR